MKTFRHTVTLSMLASLAFFGCTRTEPAPAIGEASGSLETVWTKCADYNEHCMFSGTRQVRLGRDGLYTSGTFTLGVHCARSSFPSAHLHRRGNICEVAGSVPTADAGMPMAGSEAPMPMAGAPAPTPMPTMDAGTPTMPMDMSMAPYVDKSAIPTGDPGSSERLILPTNEVPPASVDGVGAFRTVCLFSHMNFDDPLVFPGQPGVSHLHAFFGNTLTNAFSTPDSLKTTGNSTCRGGIANRTAYWVPALVNSKGIPQKPKDISVYYKSGYNGIAASRIRPFPEKLRMLAGNSKSSGPQDYIKWVCDPAGQTDGIAPNCTPGSTLLLMISFPQCWDGVHLDTADHRSHMSYAENGNCPATHPVPIPVITYNVEYIVPPTGSADLRLVSDMYDPKLRGGLSAHADWMEGWDPTLVKSYVENCINPPADCHSHLLGDGRMIYNPRE